MEKLTPVESYAQYAAAVLDGVDALMAREQGADAELERGITTVLDALTTVTAAYVERVKAVAGERDAAVEAVAAINGLAAEVGITARYEVPPPSVPTGAAGALHRAASRGVPAVVFELASIVAERAAREM